MGGLAEIMVGDCVEEMRATPENSVDAIVTDPPYGLEFMGKEWDRLSDTSHVGRARDTGFEKASGKPDQREQNRGGTWFGSREGQSPNYHRVTNVKCRNCNKWKVSGGHDGKGNTLGCKCEKPDFPNAKAEAAQKMQAWHEAWAREALRVLKPGGHLLAFGGTRTHHRLMCALEDAGFEIRDTISNEGVLRWYHGQGFPKNHDVSKALDKTAGAERKVVGSRPLAYADSDCWGTPNRNDDGAIHNSVGEWGMKGNVDAGTRPVTAPATEAAKEWEGWGTALKPSWEPVICATKPPGALGHCASIIRNLEQWEAELSKSIAKSAEKNSGLTPPGAEKERGVSAPTNAPTNTEAGADPAIPTGEADATNSEADTSASTSEAASTSLSIVLSWKSILADAYELISTSTTETETSLTTDLRTLNSLLSRTTLGDITQAASRASGSTLSALPVVQAFNAVGAKLNATRALSALENATSREPTKHRDETAKNPGSSWEPIVMARKPASEPSVARNVLRHGTGALNIDASRVNTSETDPNIRANPTKSKDLDSMFGVGDVEYGRGPKEKGRWPSNLLLGHVPPGPHGEPGCERAGTKRVKGIRGGNSTSVGNQVYGKYASGLDGKQAGYADPDGFEEVESWICVEGCPVKALDEQGGTSGEKARVLNRRGKRRMEGWGLSAESKGAVHADQGGASRFFKTFEPDAGPGFFYCAKASATERNRGLEAIPEKATAETEGRNRFKNGAVRIEDGVATGKQANSSLAPNNHPTVKPLALMRYLVKLVCPPGGTILDPFAGSGSTLVAAVQEGLDAVGIEQSEEYAEIARKRVEFAQLPEWVQETRAFLAKIERNPVLEVEVVLPPELREEPEGPQGSLF